MNPIHSKEAGFSLIGIMVAMGAILLVIAQVLFSKAEFKKSSKKIAASESYNQVLEGFTDTLGEHLAKNMDAICHGDVSLLNNINFSGAQLNYTNKIDLPASLRTQAPELASRCAAARFHQDGQLYFCLNVTPSSNLSHEAFGGAAYGVAEVILRPVDPWQQPISCSDYATASFQDAGLQMYYRTYWGNGTQGSDLKKRSGFYYVIKR